MALFGLIGRTKDLSARYAGQETASGKTARKRLEKYERGAASRRAAHRRSVSGAAAAGQSWEDAERKRIG